MSIREENQPNKTLIHIARAAREFGTVHKTAMTVVADIYEEVI
jgi:hypothetical protein